VGLRRPGQRTAEHHRRRRSRFQTMAQLSREPKLRQSTGRRRSPTQAWRLKRAGADAGPRELLSRDLPSEPARNDGCGSGNFNHQGRPLKASCRARLSYPACRTGRVQENKAGDIIKMSDARPREAEPPHTRRGGWMRHPAAADEPRRRYRTKSYCDAPRTMKMGTIASPWPMMPRPAARSNR